MCLCLQCLRSPSQQLTGPVQERRPVMLGSLGLPTHQLSGLHIPKAMGNILCAVFRKRKYAFSPRLSFIVVAKVCGWELCHRYTTDLPPNSCHLIKDRKRIMSLPDAHDVQAGLSYRGKQHRKRKAKFTIQKAGQASRTLPPALQFPGVLS